MKKLILLLITLVSVVTTQAQDQYYKITEFCVGTNYNAITEEFKWTEFEPTDILMIIGDDNSVYIDTKQRQYYTFQSEESIGAETHIMHGLDTEGNCIDLVFMIMGEHKFLMVDFDKAAVLYKFTKL